MTYHVVCEAFPRWGYRPGETLMVLDNSPTMTRLHAGEFSRLPPAVRAAMLAKAPRLTHVPKNDAPEDLEPVARHKRMPPLSSDEMVEIVRRTNAGEHQNSIAFAIGRNRQTIRKFLRSRATKN